MRRPGCRRRKARALTSARATLPARFDAAFPRRGPCLFCVGFKDGRHRLLDAIRSRHRAGDSVAVLARDYGRFPAQIRLALETCLA